MSDALIGALRAAVEAAPDNAGVRLQLAEALLGQGEAEEALLHARSILAAAPADAAALDLAARSADALGDGDLGAEYARLRDALGGLAAGAGAPRVAAAGDPPPDADPDLDLDLEVDPDAAIRLRDVGGMASVKRELERAFLTPLRHPDLREHYGAAAGGGLLLYGPPGCGKTMLARAVAGELSARFVAVGLHDVLDMWLGESERKLHELFEYARRRAPCVLFFDEVDALGQKRGHVRGSAGRTLVNQLLSEIDGIASSAAAEGLYVLAATNHPWDVDTALRRPGRFDRSLLVLPPDEEARTAILELHLRGVPTEGVDLRALARRTDGYSGADLALICRTARSSAMERAIASGTTGPVGDGDLDAARRETSPSTRGWFKLAYNYAAFANDGGEYDELLAYIRKHKLA